MSFNVNKSTVQKLISWKYSLEQINGELNLATKKKNALDKLFNEGKVSQPTYDSFSNEVAEAIVEIEAKQKILVEKMTTKISELEQQMKTLEFLLVNSEIRHVSGEIEEGTYNRENEVLSLGLETIRQELDEIKEAVSNLNEQEITLQQPSADQVEEGEQVEPETQENPEIVMDTEASPPTETPIENESSAEEQVEASEETLLEGETTSEENIETPEESTAETEETQESSPEQYQESFQTEETIRAEEPENTDIVQEVPTETEASSEISTEEEMA